MSTPESPFSPSRQVERIREILVGRQLAAVGRRLERLERGVAAGDDGRRPGEARAAVEGGVEEAGGGGVRLERRPGSGEEERRQAAELAARIHAALEQLARRVDGCPSALEFDERLGSLREELRQEQTRLQTELRQEVRSRAEVIGALAARVGELAAAGRQPAGEVQDVAIERLRASIEDWQRQLLDYLSRRERWLIDQLRAELERLRDETWHWLGELHRAKVGRSEFESRVAPPGGAARLPPSPWQQSPG